MASCFKVDRVVTPYGSTMGVVVDDAVTELPQCQIVGISGAEYSALKNGSGSTGANGGGACTNPFSMSAEDGGLLSAAIVGCWAAAYFVRSVINVVKNGVET